MVQALREARRTRVNTRERRIAVTIGKYIRTFPLGLSYLMSPGSEVAEADDGAEERSRVN
jgi:hypothetical protein